MHRNKTSLLLQMLKPLTAAVSLALAAILTWSVFTLPPYPDQVQKLAFENIRSSGVENSVTAVLLNYRGYDTLLEIGVLLLAAIGVLAVGAPSRLRPYRKPRPILLLLLQKLLPVIVILSGYILWVGKYAPGGAFQAGALLAGGAILYVSAMDRPIRVKPGTFKPAMAAGLLVFAVVAVATLITRGQFLGYPVAYAGSLILAIEAAATVSIGAILILLFIGGEPPDDFSGAGQSIDSQNSKKETEAK